MTKKEQADTLDSYDFSTKRGFNGRLLKIRYQELRPYFKGSTCLEVGCGDGEGTKILLQYFRRIVAVDGSQKLIQGAANEIQSKKVLFVHSLFEDFKIAEQFDTIVSGHILEHVENPVKVLRHISGSLKRGGVFLIDVPNAFSIHRQMGVAMGLIKNEHSLNEFDRSVGHRRIYDFQNLMRDVGKSGLRVIHKGGLFLKPFSNDQMEELLQKDIIDAGALRALTEMGKRYPEIAAEIFVVAALKR